MIENQRWREQTNMAILNQWNLHNKNLKKSNWGTLLQIYKSLMDKDQRKEIGGQMGIIEQENTITVIE